jgi:1-acyl-sn-glycerol-3-phosphate acyltransferase
MFMKHREMRLHYHFFHVVSRPLLKSFFKFQVLGAHNVPLKSGALIMSNHASYMDPIFMGAAVDRNLNYMARSTLFRPDIIKWFLLNMNAFPVHLGVPDRKAIRNALRLLKNDNLLLIFPEGTRTRDGSLGEAKPGIGLIAHKTDSPVVPAFLSGSREVLPRGANMIKFSRIRVFFGKPLNMEYYRKREATRETYVEIGKEVMRRIGELKAISES